MKKLLPFILMTHFLCSCNEGSVDTNAFAEELKDRKIIHLSQGDISTMAEKAGKVLVDTLSVLLADCSTDDSCCSVLNYEVTKAFIKDFDAAIQYISIKDSNQLSGTEKEVFDAYMYLLQNNLPMNANVQNLKNGYWLYSFPVTGDLMRCENSPHLPFQGVWNIKMSQKLLIRTIGK